MAFYAVKSGLQWRMTPDSFPPWQTVCSFYIRAVDKGLWDRITNRPVTLSRTKAGRKPKPTYAQRTFSWFNGSRRLSKDCEILSVPSEAMIKLSHTRVLLNHI